MSKRNRIKNSGNRKPIKNSSSITLSSYDDVVLEIPFIEISDAQVLEQMEETARSFPEYRAVDAREIQPQDHLMVTMKTSDGSYPVSNLTYENHLLDLSDIYMPVGLREHLMTMKVGETKTVSYEAPGPQIDKSEEAVLIPVESVITLHEIQEPYIPEITDEWVATYIPGADTVEEFRMRVKRQMENKAKTYYEEMKYSQCAAVLASRLEGRIPDELFEQGMNSSKREFETMLKQTGLTREQYLQRQGMSEEELTFQFMSKGRQMISEGMALEAMADYLELEVEDEDIDAIFAGATEQQIVNMRKSYEATGRGEELRRMAYCGKALEYVVAHAKVTKKRLTGSMNPLDNLPEG